MTFWAKTQSAQEVTKRCFRRFQNADFWARPLNQHLMKGGGGLPVAKILAMNAANLWPSNIILGNGVSGKMGYDLWIENER